MREFRGAYDDGLRVKRNSLVMWIVETSGAVHSDGVAVLCSVLVSTGAQCVFGAPAVQI